MKESCSVEARRRWALPYYYNVKRRRQKERGREAERSRRRREEQQEAEREREAERSRRRREEQQDADQRTSARVRQQQRRAITPAVTGSGRVYLGPMTTVCRHCQALRFPNESLNCVPQEQL